MADNDRFVIQKVEKTKCAECKFKKYEICERDENEFMLCPITNKTVSETVKKHRGKTRAEWEKIIADKIYEAYVRGRANHIGVAKAVVDRLFGEGE